MNNISIQAWKDIVKVLNKHKISYTTSYDTINLNTSISNEEPQFKKLVNKNICINLSIPDYLDDFEYIKPKVPYPLNTEVYRVIKTYLFKEIIQQYYWINNKLYYSNQNNKLFPCSDFDNIVFDDLNIAKQAAEQNNNIEKGE